MIPIQGINPHGLENRTLTYHIIVNGEDKSNDYGGPFTSENRMYCWAQIPKELRDTYGFDWTLEPSDTIEKFNSLTKYRSKKMEELETYTETDDEGNAITYTDPEYWGTLDNRNLLMIYNHTDLYFNIFGGQIDTGIPEFASVFVIDTSGSMDDNQKQYDYQKCSFAIASIIDKYVCEDNGIDLSNIVIYSGNYLTHTERVLGSLSLTKDNVTTSEQDKVQQLNSYESIIGLINGIQKQSSSESMITCLYYAIADVVKYFFYNADSDKNQTIGNTQLKAMNFTLLTDESIFTLDTLKDYKKLVSDSTAPANSNGRFYSVWFKQWQSTSDEKGNPFPVPALYKVPDRNDDLSSLSKISWISESSTKYDSNGGVNPSNGHMKRSVFLSKLNMALKQMSYYYGITFTCSIVCGLSHEEDIKNTDNKYSGHCANRIPILNIPVYSDGYVDNNTTFKENVDTSYSSWVMPSGFYVSSPHEFMYKIQFDLPSGYSFSNDLVLSDNDQFTSIDKIKSKFHKNGNSYFTFRFSGETVKLPSISGGSWKLKNTTYTGDYTVSNNDISISQGETTLNTIVFAFVPSSTT